MKRILFVDDETRVLDGLRRTLHSVRNEWEMVFAVGGEAAIAQLDAMPFDVIVTDMRMPGMDGAALLRYAREHHPAAVRIILSGYSEMEATFRTVPVAHQFLSKPCEPAVLREAIERTCGLQALLNRERLRLTIGGMVSLPSLPKAYNAITLALTDPDIAVPAIAAVVERDMGLSAKVLQLANSSFFGLTRQMGSIQSAVTYLGTSMVRNLVLSVEVFRWSSDEGKATAEFSDALYAHTVLASRIAPRLLSSKNQAEDAFAAALLHDAGKLVLASRLPEAFGAATVAARQKGCPLHVAEAEILGTTHAEVGAYLLGIWGLPCSIVEAVAHHHAPARVKHGRFDVLGAVHVANVLALDDAAARAGSTRESRDEIDRDYLRALGVEDRLTAWREIAAAVAANPGGGA